ncbi:imidazolonepropionase [Blastopirellula marina]|uniref:Imidazolonepropionase n=1 Tax=Blastopirellula marina TaxID=124 RepID=A0A2S8FSV4_9BACT|nr:MULTISPECIES: amidohydrolase family protein [Pirellulaceae]PQO35261.1 imidazolonepropionase [Blastopirellula marina]RCS53130.1 imidazolonepropionase [Bremerella cremea]
MHSPIRLLTLFAFACLVGVSAASDQIPGALPKGPVAIVGATIHPISGPAIKKGVLIFEKGKITAIGEKIEVPKDAHVIKAAGKHVYPGLFEPYSRIGLTEISSVRASNDYRESGSLNPNVKAHVSVDPDGEIIPVTRSNGVLLAMTAPSGGLISGQCAVMQLDGWTYEDMTLLPRAGMIVSMDSEEEKERLESFFDEARRYYQGQQAKSKILHDARLDSMDKVLRGEQPIILHADRANDITRAITFANQQKVRLVIFGGYDAVKCQELMKQYDIPVIISAIHRNPRRRDDPYDAAYSLAKRLQDAGIRFCISGYERSNAWNVRNLPYHAATAVAFGLSNEDAMRAITLSPAEILGVGERVGSLEKGKDATLFICDGDPLEAATQIQTAWIAGKPVDLSNKQTILYEKYQQKYKQPKN